MPAPRKTKGPGRQASDLAPAAEVRAAACHLPVTLTD